jgi:cation:H+ antiporter
VTIEYLLAIFLLCATVIGVCGTRLAAVVDALADRAGFGEALTGAVLLGAVTSLSGSVLSVTAALEGQADLALSNAYGGIAVQTVFLTVADLSYRRVNLEHAAASAENILQGALLICLLAILLSASYSPDITVLGVHPATLILLAGYGYGIHLTYRARRAPMWRPKLTSETREDIPEEQNEGMNLSRLLVSFLILALILGVTGWLLQRVAGALVERTGVSALIVGMLFTSLATSLPELVTTVAAVRRGAVTLAFSGIIGGNAYDTLFAAFADIAYRPGSIYHAGDGLLLFWLAIAVLMTAVLIMGMLVREKRGIANIGFESSLVLLIYIASVIILVLERG